MAGCQDKRERGKGKGRVALVEDSEYAVSPIAGQGASVAMVGAYVLASELAEAGGDYTQAFPRYEECLHDYVKRNQKLAKMSASLMEGKDSSWVAWLSDHLGRLMPGSVIQFFKNWGFE